MKKIILIFTVSLIMPFSVYAQTLTATGNTLDHAESKIRQLAAKKGITKYKIIEASNGNKVHMTAKVIQ